MMLRLNFSIIRGHALSHYDRRGRGDKEFSRRHSTFVLMLWILVTLIYTRLSIVAL